MYKMQQQPLIIFITAYVIYFIIELLIILLIIIYIHKAPNQYQHVNDVKYMFVNIKRIRGHLFSSRYII